MAAPARYRLWGYRLSRRSIGDPRASSRTRLSAAVQESLGNPYEILGLPRGAEAPAVRQAFRKLAATVHPDIPDTGDAATFRAVLWAYEELRDPASRKRWAARPWDTADTWEELLDQDAYAPQDDDDSALDQWEDLLRNAERREAEMHAQADWWVWEHWQRDKIEAERSTQLPPLQQMLRLMLEVKSTVAGTYEARAQNHGRPLFCKLSMEAGKDICLYYWDGRDGPEYSGWWIGPKVGGDTVFFFNRAQGQRPPAKGWRLMLDGPGGGHLRMSFASERRLEISFSRA